MIPLAWFAAYALRFNLEAVPPLFLEQAWSMLPVLLITQGASFWYVGLYRGLWRFASIPDLLRIVTAVGGSVIAAAVAMALLTRLENIPRSVFLIDAILLVLFLGGPRFAYRLYKDRHLYLTRSNRALVVGAGQAGEMLVRDLMRDPAHAFQPVGFVDDDARKQGKDLHGIPVVGECAELPQLAKDYEADIILIALPSARSQQLRRIVEHCELSGVPFRTLPRMQDLVSGNVGLRELREVKLDDLLGRDAVKLDWEGIRAGVQNRTIMVTGGGGSIGSELCRQIARLGPAHLVVFEQSEFNLYAIEQELRRDFPRLDLQAVLGDVRDAVAVDRTMAQHRPQVVFHAAAYKHVPLLEHQARIACTNNVLGTRTLARAADRCGCETFVLISTDKAVNPANIMGTTKRVAELFCQNLSARSKTHFITVRFGNVLGSAGSVIPLFQQQITRGGPVTVTHPDITRYFMTIPEASQLILQAGAMGKGGEIFVLDMGEPVKISYLAEQLIRLSGKKPNEDIEIVYTGLRPGEKLYEELFHSAEALAPTQHPKIRLAQSRQMEFARLEQLLDALDAACLEADDGQIRRLIGEMVPERTTQPGATVVPLRPGTRRTDRKNE